MDSEAQRAQDVARADRIASDAVDAQDRAEALAFETLDELRASTAETIRTVPLACETARDAWIAIASDDVRDFASTIALSAIDGETARDDAARDALADWLREEAERIASEWIAARGVCP